MPANLPKDEIDSARAAIVYAQSVRALHRKRTPRGSAQRETDIELALGRLKSVMRPLRKRIGAFPYGPQTDVAEENRQTIYETSKAIQTERRKLWKMRKRKVK